MKTSLLIALSLGLCIQLAQTQAQAQDDNTTVYRVSCGHLKGNVPDGDGGTDCRSFYSCAEKKLVAVHFIKQNMASTMCCPKNKKNWTAAHCKPI